MSLVVFGSRVVISVWLLVSCWLGYLVVLVVERLFLCSFLWRCEVWWVSVYVGRGEVISA